MLSGAQLRDANAKVRAQSGRKRVAYNAYIHTYIHTRILFRFVQSRDAGDRRFHESVSFQQPGGGSGSASLTHMYAHATVTCTGEWTVPTLAQQLLAGRPVSRQQLTS